MNIKPLKSKVYVAENKAENTTHSGIIIKSGNSFITETTKGTVLAIGNEVKDVVVGDVVVLQWNKGIFVNNDSPGNRTVLIDEEFIAAVIV